jgi:hypothetical protein
MKHPAILVALLLIGLPACAQGPQGVPAVQGHPAKAPVTVSQDVHDGTRIVGVDQFGRTFDAVSSYRPDKQVGMFFWLWIGQPYATGIYDATEITKLPNGIKLLYSFDLLCDSISPDRQAHFWGQPLWGYYNSDDEWVIRRQIQLLTIAGIDFIVFDATNYQTFPNVYPKILEVIDEYVRDGWNPPRVAFYTHARSIRTTLQLYSELYKPGLFPSAWYRMEGKPFIIAYTTVEDDLAEAKQRNDPASPPPPLPQEVLDFFSFRRPQWPFDSVYTDGFPWIEWTYPQPLHQNIMSVSVASHPNVPMSRSITQGVENWGRGWDPFLKANISANVDRGTFFQLQWDHALQVNPDIVFIGGWNEWIAIKQPWGDEYMLCDAANKEFSRDIEPMKEGYRDAFFIQLIQNVRKYKGVWGAMPEGEVRTIDLHAGVKQWSGIKNAYLNSDTKMPGRDAYGAAQTVRYTQPPPRNKVQEIRVCHDEANVYFMIRSEADITSNDGSGSWMNVLLGSGRPALKGWEGYEYRVGRLSHDGTSSVDKLAKDFHSTPVGTAEYRVSGSILQLKIPRKSIGLDSSCEQFYFKVADGVKHPEDIMDYYVSGMALPLGRLSFVYVLGNH